jgi:hypothetical protein
MKEIKGIGFVIPSDTEDYIRLDSFNSLADIDIAVFSPNLTTTGYSTYEGTSYNDGQYEGKKLYNKASSVSIKEHSEHWKNELVKFLEAGGTLFVILTKKDDFFIYTGTKDFSGTGRNQKTTHHVGSFTNYNFLPFSKITYHLATGKTIIPNSPLTVDLFKNFKDMFTFDTYLVGEGIAKGIFTTKNNDRILGASLTVKNGHVIFLPNIDFDDPKFTKRRKKTNAEFWTAEAIKRSKIFINTLIEIDRAVRKKGEKTARPNWASEIELAESKLTLGKIEKLSKEIERKKLEIDKLNILLEEQESLKDLLFETGKPLENSVIRALEVLGYSAENYNDGTLELDQVILSPEGHRFIGECEGKDNKDIDITKFRQLLDGLNADFEKQNVTEKAFGLLFGNPQRLTEPKQRNLDFTDKCKVGAKREKIGLIRTADLFEVCKIIIENNDLDYARQCREAVFNQMGEIIQFPKYK